MSATTAARQSALFATFSRRVVLPVLRSPLGRLVGTPVLGYYAVLTTTGRRSGLPRDTPLTYAILDGSVYVLAGHEPRTDWLANLRADPRVRVRLPGRVIDGYAALVTDPAEAQRAATAIGRAAGYAMVAEGINPVTATDAQLGAHFAGRPVVRVRRHTGEVVAGPEDPGGRAWVLGHVVAPALVLGGAWWARRRTRRA